MWTWFEKVFCMDDLPSLENGVPTGVQDWLKDFESNEWGYTVEVVQLSYVGQDRDGHPYVLALAKCRYSG